MASMNFTKIGLLVCIALCAACSGKSDTPPSAPAPTASPVTSLQTVTLTPGAGAAIGQ